MNTQIDLIRHAGPADAEPRFVGQHNDKCVSDKRAMMDALAGERYDIVYSSTLQRAASFARSIARQQHISCKLRASFQDYHYGCWQNQLVSAIVDQNPHAFEQFMLDPEHNAPEGAEEYASFQVRLITQWRKVCQESVGKKVLIVTHGAPMRVLLGSALAVESSTHLRFEVPPACVSRVRLIGEGWPPMLVFHNRASA